MMKSYAIIGGQNGDEGKGKVSDWLASVLRGNVLVVRYQGGGNAGHTVEVGDEKYALHQVSSGIIRPNTYCFLGKGMFIEPRKLRNEISGLRKRGIEITPDRLGISSKAHITLDYHTAEDQADFNLEKHKSTGNGIRQTARDKADRVGIRFIEFLDKDLMADFLKNRRFPDGMPKIRDMRFPDELKFFESYESFLDSYDGERKFLSDFLALEHKVVSDKRFDCLINEGAQGMSLDIDDGQYPGITSSCPGQPPHRPGVIIGVFKAYTSSVGIGDRPFVSEMEDPTLQEIVRREWGEFGTTTGKPRNVGWFDAVASRYNMETAHMDHITLTCLDKLEVLAKLGKKVKIARGYNVGDESYPEWDISFDKRSTLRNARPVYIELDHWDQTVEKDGKTLTPNAKRYVQCIEGLMGKKISLIGTGPKDKDIIVRQNIAGVKLGY